MYTATERPLGYTAAMEQGEALNRAIERLTAKEIDEINWELADKIFAEGASDLILPLAELLSYKDVIEKLGFTTYAMAQLRQLSEMRSALTEKYIAGGAE